MEFGVWLEEGLGFMGSALRSMDITEVSEVMSILSIFIAQTWGLTCCRSRPGSASYTVRFNRRGAVQWCFKSEARI